MKTPSPKQSEIQRDWYVVDAQDQVLGRMATKIAHVLRGKNKPYFAPHADTGDFVVVINADKVRFTGKKETSSTDIPSSATFMVAARPANPPPTIITRCLLINITFVTRLLKVRIMCLQLKK